MKRKGLEKGPSNPRNSRICPRERYHICIQKITKQYSDVPKKKKERELNKRDEPRTKKQKCEKGSQERTLNSQKNSRLFAEKDHEWKARQNSRERERILDLLSVCRNVKYWEVQTNLFSASRNFHQQKWNTESSKTKMMITSY